MGSLLAMWLAELRAAPLILLGRSGRGAAESAWAPQHFGAALVTLARCDVASAEEAHCVLNPAAAACCEPLQVMPVM